MLVVADTGPLNYLLQLGKIDILARRFGSVIVPNAVRAELLHAKAPEIVRVWAASLPPWVQVLSTDSPLKNPDLQIGERECLSLALKLKADAVLMDDLAARDDATQLGLLAIGTLGLIGDAHLRGWLNFEESVTQLRNLKFRISNQNLDRIRQILSAMERDR